MASPLLPEFDGINLIITLASTVTEVDVEADLYSQWKEWIKIDDNGKFPPAFRAIGGDPLTGALDAGAYFFIQNQDGWRIRPAEEDATVLVIGNLAAEDPDTAIAIPTIGAFTVLLLGLQPITQSAETILVQTQANAYGDSVSIDTDGTTTGTSFPAGTPTDPVNNLTDAVAIAINRGITKFIIHGPLTLTQAFSDWTFVGTNLNHTVLNVNGQDCQGSTFTNITLTGAFAAIGSPQHPMSAQMCRIADTHITDWVGTMFNTVFAGDVSLQAGDATFVQCSSEVAGTDTPTVERNGLPGDLNFRAWTGGLEILNFANGDNCSVDLLSGHLILGPTNTNGTVVLRGVGKLTDTRGSPQVLLNKDGFINGEDIKLIKQLTGGNATVSVDDLTVTIFDEDGVTTLATYSISADGRIRTRTS